MKKLKCKLVFLVNKRSFLPEVLSETYPVTHDSLRHFAPFFSYQKIYYLWQVIINYHCYETYTSCTHIASYNYSNINFEHPKVSFLQ